MTRPSIVAAVLIAIVCLGAAVFVSSRSESDGRLPQPAQSHHLSPPPQASFASKTLHPEFDPSKHRYVARCVPGSVRVAVHADPGTRVAVAADEPRSGDFGADAPVLPGQDFEIRASRGESRETYRVRCLPADFPEWHYRALRRVPRGLFTLSVQPSHDSRPWVIVFDQDGTPRWWYSPPTTTLWSQVLADGNVSWSRAFGDGYGLDPRMAHEVHTLSAAPVRVVRTEGSITDGHEYQELPGGNVLIDSFRPRSGVDLSRYGGPKKASVVLAEVQEVDPSGDVVWSWNSFRHISLDETGRWWYYALANPHPGPGGSPTYDAVHINAIEPFGPDRLIISTRHTDAIYCIERSTGRILWKLGGTRTPRSLRIIGDPYPRNQLFGGPHDVRVDAEGILSLYDDATHRPRPPRLVRYRLDLKQRTATFLDQLTDPEITASHCCGSARRMGGGWLIDWGDNPLITGFDAGGRIAFRLHLTASSYRAIPVPPGAVPAGGFDSGLERMEPGNGGP